MPSGKDILETLISLLEEQEQIKITYTIKGGEEISEQQLSEVSGF